MTNAHFFMAAIMLWVSVLWLILLIPPIRHKIPKIYLTVRSWWWMLLVLFASYLGGALSTTLFFILIGLQGINEVVRLWHPLSKQRLLDKLRECNPEQCHSLSLEKRYSTIRYAFKKIDFFMLASLIFFIISAIALNYKLDINNQRGILFFLIFSSQFSDVAQYLSGKALGRKLFTQPKFIYKISPNKTLEGAVFGSLLSSVIGGLLGYWLTDFSLHLCFLLAYLIAWLGITGDLLESIFKRRHHIKDTGTFIAGHGGVLDRIDSLLLSLPVFTLIYWFL